MDIVTYGNPVLGKPSVEVGEITPELKALAQDMLEAMYKAEGVGLAAQQVGRTEALCVIDVPADCQGEKYVALQAGIQMPMILFNPVVSELEGTQRGGEGCLSFPGISFPVTRANSCRVDYTGIDGKHYSVKTYGLLARAVQHETDHLKGVCFIEKASPTQALLIKGKLARLKKQTLKSN